MNWIVLASLCALFDTAFYVGLKKFLPGTSATATACILNLVVTTLSLPFVYYYGLPEFSLNFIAIWIIAGALNLTAMLCKMEALKEDDISLVAPMISFTPLLILITGPLIVGEFPNSWGLLGVLLIVIGAYTLNISARHEGFFAPFKALISIRGTRLMLFVAFIYSVSSNVDKLGVLSSYPYFWVFAVACFRGLSLTPHTIMQFRSGKITNPATLVSTGLILGLLTFGVLSTQMMAIELTQVAYVISFKRSSIVLSSIVGFLLFKETGMRERLPGALIMFFGILCITLGG